MGWAWVWVGGEKYTIEGGEGLTLDNPASLPYPPVKAAPTGFRGGGLGSTSGGASSRKSDLAPELSLFLEVGTAEGAATGAAARTLKRSSAEGRRFEVAAELEEDAIGE